MPTEERTINQILKEHIDLKGLSVDRLIDMSGVPDRYLRALVDGNIKHLPAAPYVHAYLKRIAPILDLMSEDLIRIYDNQISPQRSGPHDSLPTNRFAPAPKTTWMNKRTALLAIIALALIAYLAWGASRLFGIPELSIISPAGNLETSSPTILIQGTVSKGDLLTINNNEVYTDENGYFEKEYVLEQGTNVITLRASRFLGKTTVVTRYVHYNPINIP